MDCFRKEWREVVDAMIWEVLVLVPVTQDEQLFVWQIERWKKVSKKKKKNLQKKEEVEKESEWYGKIFA